MIISRNTSQVSSNRLQVLVLLLALIFLPLGMAYGQDKGDRAEKHLDMARVRLQAAVEAGEMSQEDADAKVAAIQEKMETHRAKYEAVVAEIKAAVEAGEITEEQAEAKLAAMKKKGHGKKNVDYEAIGKKIRAAVEAGEITEEEGREKMAGLRLKMAHGDRGRELGEGLKKRYAIAAKEIKVAIKAGDITEEQGKERLAALKERLARTGRERGHGEDVRARYAAAVEKIKAAVEAGEITEEEAKEKFGALRKRIAASREGGARGGQAGMRVRYAAAVEKIKAAVEAGEMTEEEAEEKMAGLRKRIAASRERGDKGEGENLRARYRAAVEKIRAAGEAGEITEEEAKEKVGSLRRRIAASREDGEKGEHRAGEHDSGASEHGGRGEHPRGEHRGR